jgi:NADPH:quinone reductase-like Zn-dependent oxidoreductase
VRFFSSVTANEKTSDFGREYWVENLVSQVRFRQGLEALCKDLRQKHNGHISPLFIEIGPHPALAGPVRQTISALNLLDFEYTYTSPLVRNQDARQTALEMAGKIFQHGYEIDFNAVSALSVPVTTPDPEPRPAVVTGLPPYAWDHSNKYWHESRLSRDYRMRSHSPHDLLGLRCLSTNSFYPTWRNIINIDRMPWLRDHVVDNFVIFPGSGYLCMAIEAAGQLAEDKGAGSITSFKLENIHFIKALVVPEPPASVELQIVLHASGKAKEPSADWKDFAVVALSSDGQWFEHCRGSISVEYQEEKISIDESHEYNSIMTAKVDWYKGITGRCTKSVERNELYERMKRNGNIYGETFADITDFSLGELAASARLKIPNVASQMPASHLHPHYIHPTTLDAIAHTSLPLYEQHGKPGSVMPISIGSLTVSASIPNLPGEELFAGIELIPRGNHSATANIVAFGANSPGPNEELRPVVTLSDLQIVVISDGSSPVEIASGRNSALHVEWIEDPDFYVPANKNSNSAKSLVPTRLAQEEVKLAHVFDCAACLYVERAIAEIGQMPGTSPSNIQETLYSWMKQYSSSTKTLLNGSAKFGKEHVHSKAPVLGPENASIEECMRSLSHNLVSVVTGEVDPFSLLLDDDQMSRLDSSRTINQLQKHIQDYITRYSLCNQNLKVLHAGAGTGLITRTLLQALTDHGRLRSFDNTDIRLDRLEMQKDLLAEWDEFVNYRLLDTEQDPLAQGYVLGSYDLIVLNNAFYSSNSVQHELRFFRSLLKAGGKILIIGLTGSSPMYNLLFNTYYGWWNSSRSVTVASEEVSTAKSSTENSLQLVPSSGISVEEWNSQLLKSSYNGIDLPTGTFYGQGHSSYCIVSTAIESPKTPFPSLRIINMVGRASHIARNLSQVIGSGDGFNSIKEINSHGIEPDALYLLIDNATDPLLTNRTQSEFSDLTKLLSNAKSVLWLSIPVTCGDSPSLDAHLVTGFARVARRENEAMRLVTFSVQEALADYQEVYLALVGVISANFHQEQRESYEAEYAYKHNKVWVPRLVPVTEYETWSRMKSGDGSVTEMARFTSPDRVLKLGIETPGLIHTLRFEELSVGRQLGSDEIEIEALAYGITAADVFITCGGTDPRLSLTSEVAGKITALGSNLLGKWEVGDSVCGFMASPITNYPILNSNLVHRLPSSLSFEEGASILYAFVTAYYVLTELGRVCKGDRILLHSADSECGQAVLIIARNLGVEVFATVQDAHGRELLTDRYKMPVGSIFSAKPASFRPGIMRSTGNQGVTAAITFGNNSLEDTWACIANLGTLIEISQPNAATSSTLPKKNSSFVSFDLGVLIRHRSELVGRLMNLVMSMFQSGVLEITSPIIRRPITEIGESFRSVQYGKLRGKLVLSVHPDSLVKSLPRKPESIRFRGKGTYVIAGGLGDLGRGICLLLADCGATHILILSRSGASRDPRKKEMLQLELAKRGTQLHVLSCDITASEAIREASQWCTKTLPPVRGIIQSAAILQVSFRVLGNYLFLQYLIFDQDRMLEAMDSDTFQAAVRPKRDGTINLMKYFMGQDLDFFIMLASAISALGTKGKASFDSLLFAL